jgi:ribosomal protein S18 acetylase RimI-like enzyme
MLVDSFRISGPPDYCTIGDLDWWRFTDADTKVMHRTRIWLNAEGAAIGLAWPERGETDILVHPGYRNIEEEMIAWAEDQRAGEIERDGTKPTHGVWSHESDRCRLNLLQRRGYVRDTEQFNHRVRSLESVAEPVLPPGFQVRHIAGETDLEQRAAVQRNAFGSTKMTTDTYRRVMRAPTYRQELDLVIEAPDGTLVAFCIVWFDEANANGVFEPVGCHSEYRQRGLGKAIMLEGCRRLQALGARTACVLCVTDDPAANRLYESAGFRFVDRSVRWTLSLTPATS